MKYGISVLTGELACLLSTASASLLSWKCYLTKALRVVLKRLELDNGLTVGQMRPAVAVIRLVECWSIVKHFPDEFIVEE